MDAATLWPLWPHPTQSLADPSLRRLTWSLVAGLPLAGTQAVYPRSSLVPGAGEEYVPRAELVSPQEIICCCMLCSLRLGWGLCPGVSGPCLSRVLPGPAPISQPCLHPSRKGWWGRLEDVLCCGIPEPPWWEDRAHPTAGKAGRWRARSGLSGAMHGLSVPSGFCDHCGLCPRPGPGMGESEPLSGACRAGGAWASFLTGLPCE